MREFKFKAWSVEGKRMIFENENGFYRKSYIGDNGCWQTSSLNDIFKREDVKVMQYTGLKDKNGVEVYEGDILKRTVNVRMYGTDLNEYVDDIVEVEYRKDYAGFYLGERPLFSELYANYDFYTSCKCTQFEVVGNIYEHGNLLEKNKINE